jgi:hypothetical protein
MISAEVLKLYIWKSVVASVQKSNVSLIRYHSPRLELLIEMQAATAVQSQYRIQCTSMFADEQDPHRIRRNPLHLAMALYRKFENPGIVCSYDARSTTTGNAMNVMTSSGLPDNFGYD